MAVPRLVRSVVIVVVMVTMVVMAMVIVAVVSTMVRTTCLGLAQSQTTERQRGNNSKHQKNPFHFQVPYAKREKN